MTRPLALALAALTLVACRDAVGPDAKRPPRPSAMMWCDDASYDPNCNGGNPEPPPEPEAPPNLDEPTGYQGYVLSGWLLKDANGTVVGETPTDVLPSVHSVIESDNAVRIITATVLGPAGYVMPNGEELEPPTTGQGTPPDLCTSAFWSLYEQTRDYMRARDEYWQKYILLAIKTRTSPWEPPSPAATATLVMLGVDIIAKRTGLDFLATEIRLWGCLN
jgi:hypothetical protein